MLQGESIFHPIFSHLFPFDIRYRSDAVLSLTYNYTHLCTNVPQQEGQQGLFLCLSYHVPVKEMPHLAQILQTHMMTPPPNLKLSREADTCNDGVMLHVVTDSQYAVLWPDLSIYRRERTWLRWRWTREFNFILCRWILTVRPLIRRSHCTVQGGIWMIGVDVFRPEAWG